MATRAGVKRLNDEMERRRIELDMSWREVAVAAQLSYEGLRGIRRGDRNPSTLTARRLDAALQWAPGSIDVVLQGGPPTPVDAGDTTTVAHLQVVESHEEAQPLTPVLGFPADYPDDMELTEQEKRQWQTLRDISPDARRRVIQYARLERERETQQEQQTSP